MRRLGIVVPAVLLCGLLLALFLTRGSMEELGFLRQQGQTELVDQRPYLTAQTLAGMAASSEEQRLAEEAERLADHEVDQAFAMALRQASLTPKPQTAKVAAVASRVAELKALVKDDKARVDALEATAKTSGVASQEGDELDVAKAQLGLDQDELTDATADLATESGDQRGKIQQELAAREASMKDVDSGHKETAVMSSKRYTVLWGQIHAWSADRSRVKLIAQAERGAEADVKRFAQQHAELERMSGTVGVAQGAERVKALQAIAGHHVLMSILDDRAETERQLAAVYARWQRQIWLQHRTVRHLILQSLAWVMFVVLAASLAGAVGRMLVRRVATDPRRAETLETILTLAVEAVGLLLILLVVFGAPQQTPTILGLATAGLTVVFQDFILAFFGWFVLMGRNGIRVGDWVEINGVGGEIAEIGLFRTAMLEAGNWTSPGHVTGRRVTFINSFAIRGQYFNFSTHGQWMWDEIALNVPATANAYELIKQMQAAVEKETSPDAEQAEQEWRSATRQQAGLTQFSATPTVDLRPAAAGVDVVVRFVTRASERFEMRRRVNEALLGLMKGTEKPATAAAIAAPAGPGT